MRMLNITLRNFKSIKDFYVDFGDANLTIFSRNKQGKTTIADAYFWLLFGKDSRLQTDFPIKPTTFDALDYMVTATFVKDGNEFTLKRELKENYVTKRGETEARFTGTTTDYYIDDIPKKKAEYDTFVNSLCTENLFIILSDTDTLAGKMHWEKRRAFLFDTFGGEMSDEDIFNANPRFAPLKTSLDGRTMTDYTAYAKSQLTTVKKDVKMLPSRIDEAQKALSEPIEIDYEAIGLIKSDIEALTTKIQVSSTSSVQTELNEQLLAEKSAYNSAERAYMDKQRDKYSEDIGVAVIALDKASEALATANRQATALNNENTENNRAINRVGIEFTKAKGLTYSVGFCNACKRPLDEIDGQEAEFNKTKAETVHGITARGHALRKQIDDNSEHLDGLNRTIEALTAEKGTATKTLNDLRETSRNFPPFETIDTSIAMSASIATLQAELNDSLGTTNDYTAQLKQELADKNAELQEYNKKIARQEIYATQADRILDLKAQLKTLLKLQAELSITVTLIEQFVMKRALSVEERINKHFTTVKWKLFEEQVNGGINSTCYATVNDVSYNKGLSCGERVVAGLDIINAIIKATNVTVPIFIDNSESVTEPMYLPVQMIHLEARKGIDEIKIERKE